MPAECEKLQQVANAKKKNVDPDARDFLFFGSTGLMYACGNCDICEDVGSSVYTDEVCVCGVGGVIARSERS